MMLGPIDWQRPANREHPLVRDGVMWFKAVKNHAGWGSFTARPLIGREIPIQTTGASWRDNRIRPGGLGSLEFSGAHGNYATATAPVSTNRMTIIAFYRMDVFITYQAIIESRDAGLHGLLIAGGPVQTYGWENSGDEYGAATGLSVSVDKWYMHAVSIGPTAATVYRGDCETGLVSSWTNTKTHNTKTITTWRIGSDPGAGGREVNGLVDEIFMAPVTYSEDQIKAFFFSALRGHPELINRVRRTSRVLSVAAGGGAATVGSLLNGGLVNRGLVNGGLVA